MMEELQKRVNDAVMSQTPPGGKPYWPLLIIISRLAEEVGEVSSVVLYDNACKPEADANLYKGNESAFVTFARTLTGMGEIGRDLNHFLGLKKKKSSESTHSTSPGTLEEEIGDAIFTLTCLANSKGVDLDAAVNLAIDKCYGRDKDRFRGNDGGN